MVADLRAGTVCSVQPAPSHGRGGSLVATAAAAKKTIAEHDREPDQPRRRQDVEQAALPLRVARAGRRRAPLRRLRALRGVRGAIFPGHRRAIVPIRRDVPSDARLYRSSARWSFSLSSSVSLLGAIAVWLYASRRLGVVERELAGTRAELDVERRSFDEKVVTAVRAASADAYQANSSAFLEIAESKLTGYVKPLKESLEKVDGQVRTLELARERAYGALGEQLSQLSERTADAGDGAADAARPRPLGRDPAQARRRAGRNAPVLRLRPAGDARRPTTGRLRPDLIVRLPGGKVVIVDAKVPLAAYLDSLEATEDDRARRAPRRARAPGARAHGEAEREELLAAVRRHAGLRRHVPARRRLLPRRLGAGSVARRDGRRARASTSRRRPR